MAEALQPSHRAVNLSWAGFLRHAWNLAPMILVHGGAVAVIWTGGSLRDWLVFLGMVYVRGLLTTIGYHRYFSHRSFKTSRVVQFLLGAGCCANLQQGPLWWAAYHRHHHLHSDDENDIHSPYHGGFFWAYCGWLFIPLADPWHRIKDLTRYRELVWLERFWQVPGILLAALFWWLGGWSLLCVGFCLSAVATFHLTFFVNTLGHLIGSQRYPTGDHSTNSFVLAAITLGDGWHNNHHHYPHSAQAGFFWWEIDAAYRVIRLLERVGLVWDVRRVPPHKLDPAVKEAPAAETPAARDAETVGAAATPASVG